jgi:RHS repeat-associated protein
VPSTESEPNNTNVTTFSYQMAGSVIEPTEVLAPVPANVSCTGTLVRGCRALRFVYAASTTATGEGASEWGDYVGRLKQVTFTAWDPSTSAMSTTTVAQYSYDKQGRLRAEWDPRISPAVKTTYGYDAEGRVTSLLPAGEQPWLLVYGTAIGDLRLGHLLTATRPAPTTAAGPGVAPQLTLAPTLASTNAPEGKTMTVSTGTWSNTPLAYGYQWEECQTVSGAEVCTPLPGSTNASYRVVYHGAGRWLKVLVTAINASGATMATTTNSGIVLSNPSYMEKSGEFATKGSGNGQLNNPSGIATDGSGNVWVADTANNRVEKFSAAGAFIAAYGTLGSGPLQFKGPSALAIDSAGELWVSDTGNSRVEVLLTSTGAYVGAFGTGAATAPTALAIFKAGTEQTIYVGIGSQINAYRGTSPNAMTAAGVYGGAGTGSGQFTGVGGLAVDEAASKLYATDTGGHRVEVFSITSVLTYQSQYGTAGTTEGHFVGPQGLAVQSGYVFVADKTNGNVQKFSGSSSLQTFTEAAGVYGVATYPKATNGSMYVLNQTTGKIAKWVTATRPPFVPTPPSPGTSAVTTVEYGVPISGTGAPYAMGSNSVEGWGQTDVPVEAMAVLPPDSPQAWPASSYARATVYYLDSLGRTVNRATPSKGISTTEYNSTNDVVRTLSPLNRAKALTESKPAEVSKLLDSQSTYSEDGSEVLSTVGPQHTVRLAGGSQVLARHKTRYFYDEGAPGTGGPYHLVTKLTEGALLTGGTEEDVHTTVNSYAGQEGLGWKLHAPTSITTDPTGLKLVRTKLYDATTGAVTDAIMPAGNQAGGDSHDTQTIYYTALTNAKVAACGLHPEWANLPCQSKLAKAPETAGIPNPPVTTNTYNLWDEAVEATSVVGADSRKVLKTYDAAGRPKTEAVTSTTGTARPMVTFGYDSTSGQLVTSSTTEGSTTRTLTSVMDMWGDVTEYTDADGVTSKYTYDIDGRVATTNDGKGTSTSTYGLVSTTISDSALTYVAEYDVEGNVRAEYFGSGVVEKSTFNATGQLTGVEYVDQSSCSTNCTWYSDSIVPSITEQWMTQSSTLSGQAYKYDAAGRLTQVQDTPTGVGCTTRIYAYDADANRSSETARVPGTGGVCASEGGTTVSHSYDPADRVKDTGAAYDAFGDTTSLPAGDAGGSVLTGSYYVNGRTATQTQNGQTNGFYLDPAGRTREMVATGTKTLTSVLHYGSNEDSPSWTAEGPTGWTRDVEDVTGALIATQTNGEAPIMQITNLHGDVVATAALTEAATGLSSSNDTTEFGVPRTSSPPKYSWLGSDQRSTTLASGVVAMGARSYVPQLGRLLQADPIAGGSANAYAYGSADPVNNSDPSGESTSGLSGWLFEVNDHIGQEIVAREAAREAAARLAAEEAAQKAAEAAAAATGEYESPEDSGDPLDGMAWNGDWGNVTHGIVGSLVKKGKDVVKRVKRGLKRVVHAVANAAEAIARGGQVAYHMFFKTPSHRDIYCAYSAVALWIVVPEAAPLAGIGLGMFCAEVKIPGVE